MSEVPLTPALIAKDEDVRIAALKVNTALRIQARARKEARSAMAQAIAAELIVVVDEILDSLQKLQVRQAPQYGRYATSAPSVTDLSREDFLKASRQLRRWWGAQKQFADSPFGSARLAKQLRVGGWIAALSAIPIAVIALTVLPAAMLMASFMSVGIALTLGPLTIVHGKKMAQAAEVDSKQGEVRFNIQLLEKDVTQTIKTLENFSNAHDLETAKLILEQWQSRKRGVVNFKFEIPDDLIKKVTSFETSATAKSIPPIEWESPFLQFELAHHSLIDANTALANAVRVCSSADPTSELLAAICTHVGQGGYSSGTTMGLDPR